MSTALLPILITTGDVVMGKKLTQVTITILFAFTIVAFQNCAPTFVTVQGEGSLDLSSGLRSSNSFGKSGLRRLTRTELRNTLFDNFGVEPGALMDQLAEDTTASIHFDNEYATQSISPMVVQGYDSFAEQYSTMVANDTSLASRLAGCTPTKVDDRVCFGTFLKKVGRRLLRRQITDVEVQRYSDLLIPFAISDKRFNTALQLAINAFIQHPAMLYRIEAATDFQVEPGIYRLDGFEIATRIAFVLWGSAPDDALLDAAEFGDLSNPTTRLAQANRMLASNKAKRQIQNFHGQWMGFQNRYLSTPLENDMRNESAQLVNKIVFDLDTNWMDIFRYNQTFVTPALAQHYGMPPLTQPAWVTYTNGRGGGILAHGAFLTAGAKFGDTSPTLRGYEIYKRLMCGKLGTIPDFVDTDIAPGNPTDCKPTRYSMRNMTTCATCHNITDNIGFGLENFGALGEWRTTEPGLPNCAIDNSGVVNKVAYSGPKELGELFANDPTVIQCAQKQLFRFVTGRLEDSSDALTIEAMQIEFLKSPKLKSTLLALIASPGFANK
jgi:hypothetical protein